MPSPQILALILGLLPAAPAGDGRGVAVTAATLDVYDSPGGPGLRTGRLRRGNLVRVRREQGEWLAIDPPAGSFSWIDAKAIREAADGRAKVIADRVPVRPGSPGAHLPGPPGCTLERGESVRLLGRRPLTLGKGAAARTWLAIAPPPEEVRYVRASGVEPPEPEGPSPAASGRLRLAALATVAPGADADAPVSPELKRALDEIEADHRGALQAPMENWELGPIQDRYRSLLDAHAEPGAKAAVQSRLDQVARQQKLSKDARDLRVVLDRSRDRDSAVAALLARKQAPRKPKPDPYDARGLLQPSSKQVEGQRVFALIADDGSTAGYLDLPAGLDPSTMVGHQVGVRGASRFDADLNARLFNVHDLEPLGD